MNFRSFIYLGRSQRHKRSRLRGQNANGSSFPVQTPSPCLRDGLKPSFLMNLRVYAGWITLLHASTAVETPMMHWAHLSLAPSRFIPVAETLRNNCKLCNSSFFVNPHNHKRHIYETYVSVQGKNMYIFIKLTLINLLNLKKITNHKSMYHENPPD